MPLQIDSFAANLPYASPFVGPVNYTVHVKLDISTMTTAEVDADGYLKPGLPLAIAAGLATLVGAAPAFVYGCVVEATKLPVVVPATNTTLAAETNDCLVAVATHSILNRDIVEDNLGRVLSANELAGIDAAGSHTRLTTT